MNSNGESLRILVVAHSFVVPSNRARWELLAELHDDVDVTLVVPSILRTARYGVQQVFSVDSEERSNFHVVALSTTVRGMYRHLAKLVRAIKPHVVQVNEEPSEWALFQTFLIARVLAPNAVRLFYFWTNILSRPTAVWNRLKFRSDFRLAHAAIAGSQDSVAVLKALGFSGRVIVQTELGADERTWLPAHQECSVRPFTIGYVGALLPEKGLGDLAMSVTSLRGDWRLVVIGDGPERATLEDVLTATAQRDRLDLAGFVDRSDLPERVAALDVLVLPSRTTLTWKEQFGLVQVEAMLCGVAVVGSDSGAIPEVLGDGGLIFPEGDQRALTVLLQSLMDRPDWREEIAERGRKRALRLYSASALADETYELYQTLTSLGTARQ